LLKVRSERSATTSAGSPLHFQPNLGTHSGFNHPYLRRMQ
jgi:hypothetical protein